jgi:hypothetical protein
MDMVGHTIDQQRLGILPAHNALHVIEETLFHPFIDQGSTVFGAEDEMVEQIRISARHDWPSAMKSVAPDGAFGDVGQP